MTSRVLRVASLKLARNFFKFGLVLLFVATAPSLAFPQGGSLTVLTAQAADGSGTNTVNPTTGETSTTGNTYAFTYTATETLDSGQVTVKVPNSSGFTVPQATNGSAGYTTIAASGNATIGGVLNDADSGTGWAEDDTDMCGTFGLDTTNFKETTGSLYCNPTAADSGDSIGFDISSSNWSTYDTVSFWVRSDQTTTNGGMTFFYDDTSSGASPIQEINIPAMGTPNTWTYVKATLSGTRTAVVTWGIQCNTGSNSDCGMGGTGVGRINIDEIMLGCSATTTCNSGPVSVMSFVANGSDTDISTRIIDMANTETLTITYGAGGGASGAVNPASANTYTFTTRSKISTTGTLTAISSSPTVTVSAPSITGSCKLYDQSTNCADGQEVKWAKNGTLQGDTTTTSGGAFTLPMASPPATNDIVTVFINGVADNLEAVAVTKYDGTGAIAGVNLFAEHLTLGSDDTGATLTNSNLTNYDNEASGDEDIFYESDTVAFTCNNTASVTGLCTDVGTGQSTQDRIYIKSGWTLAPGGNVRTGRIDIRGTYTAASETLTLTAGGTSTTCGNSSQMPLCINGGTFTQSAGVVNFQPIADSVILARAYYSLYIQPKTASTTHTLGAGTFDVANGILLGDGSTLSTTVTGATNNPTINASQNCFGCSAFLNQFRNTFITGTGVLTLAGTNTSSSTGAALSNSGTFTATTGNKVVYTSNRTGANVAIYNVVYYDLEINNASETYDFYFGQTVTRDFTITAGTVTTTSGSNYSISVGGSWTNSGTFTPYTGTVTFNSTSTGKTIDNGSSSFYNVIFNGSGGDWSFVGSEADYTSYVLSPFAFPGVVDTTNQVIYGGGSGAGIYRCATSTSCDADADWTTSYSGASPTVITIDFTIDTSNGVLYAAGQDQSDFSGVIMRCVLSTSCDGDGDWTVAATKTSPITSLLFDGLNGILYAAMADTGVIYRCDTSTGCDAGGEWVTSYDTPGIGLYSAVWDSTNNVIYFGRSSSGIIYRCATSTSCDASGDWTTGLDAANEDIESMVIDLTNGVIYATADGDVYRCATSTSCDATGDWTTVFNNPESFMYLDLALDNVNNILYAGGSGGDATGIIYKCPISSSCDADGDWSVSYDTPEFHVETLLFDSANQVLYAGTPTDEEIYRLAPPTPTVITGDLTMTNGTLNNAQGSANITVNGDVKCGVTCGTINLTTGTFTQSVTADKNFGTNVAVGTNWAFNNLTFTGTTDTITTSSTGTGTITVSGVLTISASTTLNAGNRTWTLSGTSGTPFVNSGTFTAGTSTVIYSGNNSGGSTTVIRVDYNHLSVTGAETYLPAGGGTFLVGGNLTVGTGSASIFNVDTNDPTLDVNGNVSIAASATLTASASAAFTVAGNFTDAGTFTHSSGTITFDTTGTSEIDGNSTVFHNFTASTSGKTVKFKQGETVRTNGLLTLADVTLTSISGAAVWIINHQGTESVSTVTVSWSDCDASSTTISSTGLTDGGNNDTAGVNCWGFTAGVTISGVVYANDETTAYATVTAMKLSVNGGTAVSTNSTVTSGVYSFTTASTPSNGDVITIWLDTGGSGGVQGTTILKYGASCTGTPNCTGLKVVLDQVRLENFHTGSLVNTDFALCDNDTDADCSDADIGFTANSGVLTTTWATNELKIASGDTFAPGGNVSTKKLEVAGTYTGASETLVLSGTGTSTTCTDSSATPLCIDSGTFTAASNTVQYTGTTATVTATTFNTLVLGPSGTYTLPNSNVTLRGSVSILGAATSVTKGSGTLVFAKGGGGSQSIVNSSNNDSDLGAVQISANSGNTTLTTSSNIKVTSMTVDASQTLDITGDTLTITGTGTPLSLGSGSTFTVTSSYVTYWGTTANIINTTYNNVNFGSGTYTLGTAGGQTITASNMTLDDGSNVTGATHNPTVNLNSLVLIEPTGSYVTGTGTLTLTDIGGGNVIDNGGGGDVIASTGSTVVYAGEEPDVVPISSNYYNLIINGGISDASFGEITIENDLTINGSLIGSSNIVAYGNVVGNGTVAFDGTLTLDPSDSTANFSGDTAWSVANLVVGTNGSSQSITTLGSGSVTINTSLTINTTNILNAGSKTWILSGTGTPFLVDGTVSPDSSTFRYTGSSSLVNIASATYNQLELKPGGTQTHRLLGGTLTVNGDLIIGDDTNAVTVDWETNDPAITVKGNITLYDPSTWTKSSTATLSLSPSGTKVITDNNGTKQDLGIVSITGGTSTPRINLASSIKAVSLALAASHTLDVNGTYTITVTGNSGTPFDINASGTFTPSTGTVDYSPSSSGTITVSSTTFHHVTFNGSGSTFNLASGGLTTNNDGDVTVTAGTLDTVSGQNYPMSIGGSFVGTGFTPRSGTVTFTKDSGTETIEPASFHNIIFTGSLATWSFVGSSVTLAGDLTMTAGALSDTNTDITVNGGDVTGNGLITLTGGTFTVDGTNGTGFGGSTGWTFYDLSFTGNSSTTTASGNGSITTSHVLTIGSGHILDAGSKTWTLSGTTGTPFVITGTFTASSSTVSYTGSNGSGNTNVAAATYNHLTVNAADTFDLAGNITINGDLTISGSSTLDTVSGQNRSISIAGNWTNSATFTPRSGTVTFTATSGTKTINNASSNFYNLIFNGSGGTFQPSTNAIGVTNDLTMTAGTLSGTLGVTVSGGDVTGNGDINMTGGTFLVDGAGNFGGDTAWDFSSLTFGDGSGATTTTTTGTGSVTIAGTLTVATAQILNAGSKTWTLSNSGTPITKNGTFTAGTSTVTYTSTSGVTALSSAAMTGSDAFYNLIVNRSGQTFTAGVSVEAKNDLTVTLGTLAMGSNNLTVGNTSNSNSGSIKVASGQSLTQTAGTTTVLGSGAGSNCIGSTGEACVGTAGTITLNNLVIGDDTTTFTTTLGATSPTITIAGDLTVNNNATLNAGSATIVLTNNGTTVFTKDASGVFAPSTSTVNFVSAGTNGTTIPATSFYNLTLNKGSNTFTASAGTLNVGGNLVLTAGTLDLNTNDPTTTVTGNITNDGTLQASGTNPLTLSGNFTNNGTWTNNSGTFVLTPTGTSVLNGTNGLNFYNFTAAGQGGKTISFKDGNSYGFYGNITFTGTANLPLNLVSSTLGAQWSIDFTGTMTIGYIQVGDSACLGNNIVVGEHGQNLGNNGACWIFIIRAGGGGATGEGAGSNEAGQGGGGPGGGGGGSEGGGGGEGGQGGGGQGGGGGGGAP